MKISRLSFLLSFLVLGLLMTACNNDDEEAMPTPKQGCTTVESDNYDPDAEEDDGSCIPWRDKFIAEFDYNRSCPAFPDKSGLLAITAGTGELGMTFTLSSQSSTVVNVWEATVTGETTFELPSQTLPNNVELSGTGTLENGQINMTYSLGTSNCTLTATAK
ncbi:MAG: hypothetical protein AAFV25_19210 [Bacteroidota bacterium]